MRLFTATLATETNTFSPLPTSLESYRESVFFGAGEHPADAPRMCTAPLFVGRERAEKEGFTLIEGSCFAASPAGTTNRADYESLAAHPLFLGVDVDTNARDANGRISADRVAAISRVWKDREGAGR